MDWLVCAEVCSGWFRCTGEPGDGRKQGHLEAGHRADEQNLMLYVSYSEQLVAPDADSLTSRRGWRVVVADSSLCVEMSALPWLGHCPSSGCDLYVIAAQNSLHCYHLSFAVDQMKFGPPLRKVTEPYPDLVIVQFRVVMVFYTLQTNTLLACLSAGLLWRRLESVWGGRQFTVRSFSCFILMLDWEYATFSFSKRHSLFLNWTVVNLRTRGNKFLTSSTSAYFLKPVSTTCCD